MRVRHIANAKQDLSLSKIVVQNPVEMKGRWKKELNCDQLRLEIGCGKGGYTFQMSQLHPNIGFVAMEKNTSIAYLAMCKLSELENTNFKILNADAANLLDYFNENEVDAIHLNFSDPWPKKRAHKRRLSHASFLNQYGKILKEDGVIIMKSDNYDLFVYSLNSFIENGWEVLEVDTDFRSSLKEDPITEYEQKFISKNVKINRMIVRRKYDK